MWSNALKLFKGRTKQYSALDFQDKFNSVKRHWDYHILTVQTKSFVQENRFFFSSKLIYKFFKRFATKKKKRKLKMTSAWVFASSSLGTFFFFFWFAREVIISLINWIRVDVQAACQDVSSAEEKSSLN